MDKGLSKKIEMQKALKSLSISKGYGNVTMKDIGKAVNLSVGGLYHHYHSVDEIFADLVSRETNDVWVSFDDVDSMESLLGSLDKYFEYEKSELLSSDSLNSLWYQYYFSFPEATRKEMMKAAHDETISRIEGILDSLFEEEKKKYISEHVYVVLHGLVDLSLCERLDSPIIDKEFLAIKKLIIELYEEENKA